MQLEKKKRLFFLSKSVILSIIVFAILLFLNVIQYGEVIDKYVDTEVFSVWSNRELEISDQDIIRQELEIGENGIYSFSIRYHADQIEDGLLFDICLYDAKTNKLVEEWNEDVRELPEDGFREYFLPEEFQGTNTELYLEIQANQSTKALYCSASNSLLGKKMSINGNEQEGDLILRATQKKNVWVTLVWGGIISLVLSILIVWGVESKIWKKCVAQFNKLIKLCKDKKVEYIVNILGACACTGISVFLEILISRLDFFEYNTVGAFNEYRFLFILAVLLCLGIIIRNYKRFKYHPEKIYFMLFIVIGLLFVLVMPSEAEISWDESIHYWKSVGVSHALSGQANIAESWLYWHSGIGYTLPNSLENLRFSQNMIQNMYDTGINVVGNTTILSQLNMIGYIPAALGLLIGRILNLPYAWTFHLGAAMNLVLYIGLVSVSMRFLKSGKMILVAVSGIVSAVFLASVYSLDSWIIGFTILGISCFVGVMQKSEKVSNRELILMLSAFTLAFMPKAIYFPLFLLFLFMPKEKFQSVKQYSLFRISIYALCITFIVEVVLGNLWILLPLFVFSFLAIYGCFNILQKLDKTKKILVIVCASCVIIGVLILCIWYILPLLLGQGDLRGGEDVNSAAQAYFILENPIEYSKILLRWAKNYYLSFQKSLQVPFKTLGYIGDTTLYVISFVFIWIVSFTDKRKEDGWKGYNKVKLGTILICGIVIALMATALYVSYTPVAYETITGCQPRYMIPLFTPFFLMIGSNKVKNEMSIGIYNGIIVCFTSIILLLSVWQVVIQFYF